MKIKELTNQDAAQWDDEDEAVSSDRIVVGSEPGREELDLGVEFVLGESLEDPGCSWN